MAQGLALEAAKATRNAAHKALRTQISQLQQDIEARSIGGRVVDRAGEAVADAAEVANEHKGVVAGTIALLALWFLRRPITSWFAHFRGNQDDEAKTERKPEDD
jgi:hypothetical protein